MRIGIAVLTGAVLFASAITSRGSTAFARPTARAVSGDTFDIIVRGGRVLDGTGNPWYRADIAIRGDRIALIGRLDDAVGRVELDATDLFVAPGFIDVHSHAGGALESEALSSARALLLQGLTTVMVNPDGGGPTDLARQRADLLEHGLGVNVALMIGHGSVRGAVIGSDDRAATADELERMRTIVREAMRQGAFGLSSGLFYSPGSFAPIDEVVQLGRIAGEYGGVYTSHIRDEADYTIGLLASVEEVITVAREAAIPGVVTHVKALGPNVWGLGAAVVHRIEQARAQGVEVYADQYPYEASSTSLSAALVPRWAQAGGGREFQRRLAHPDTGAMIRTEMVDNLARRGGANRIQISRYSDDPALEGRTLREIAAAWDVDPIAAAVRLGGVSIVSFNMHEDDIRTIMTRDWTMTASDGALPTFGVGVPHPRGYGTFPRKIRKYALDERVVTLAHAIRSMTSLPATVFRMRDRGVLREGAFADIVVFDPERITDRATYTEPHQYSEGVVHLLVNGAIAVRGGDVTGQTAGRVLAPER